MALSTPIFLTRYHKYYMMEQDDNLLQTIKQSLERILVDTDDERQRKILLLAIQRIETQTKGDKQQ